MAMEDHPSAATTLTNFEQDPSFATRLPQGSDAWRALNSLLDHRGVSRYVRLHQNHLQPQLVNERLDTYLHRNLRAFGELSDELVLPHPYVIHESILVAASHVLDVDE
jgi:hypothetical protein